MATIVNNPDSGSGGAGGWIIAAVIILVVALVAIFVWPGYGRGTDAPAAPTQVNVQLPAAGTGGDAPAE